MNEPTTQVPFATRASLVAHGAGLTHAGRIRERNEDSILTDPTGILWAVADGMGGHGHGETASDLVIERLTAMPDEADPKRMLPHLLHDANADILDKSEEFGGATIGATTVVMMILGAVANIAWVGDSRAYLWRAGALRLLTRDHSVVQDLVDQGVLDRQAARTHKSANIVTRAIGVERDLDVDMVEVPVIAGDRLLLCSDGLTDCLDDARIGDVMKSDTDPEAICRTLVAETLDRGAPDNVSVIVVHVTER